MFYVQRSQHFNQSDFGILFPWLAKKFTKAEDPEQILALNLRGMVQMMRESGVELAGTDDQEILHSASDVPRWVGVSVEDDDELHSTNERSLNAVNRKLSIGSIKGDASPGDSKDSMTMGQELEM